jgi:hypothetical protein
MMPMGTVPAGQRLVIESISQNFVAPTGQNASLFVLYQLNRLQGLVDNESPDKFH